MYSSRSGVFRTCSGCGAFFRRTVALFLALLLLAGCGAPSVSGPDVVSTGEEKKENSRSFFAMDTYMTVRAWGADDDLLVQVEDLVGTLEETVSTTLGGSALHKLNETGSGTLPEDAAYLLGRALELCNKTGGALDISIYPVVRAWGFTTADQNYRVPGDDEIAALLQAVDYTRVTLDGDAVTLGEGVEIDLGSVTKGYVGDRIAALLSENGVTSALMDLGGNIQTLGSKPDGSDWRVAIRNPEGDGILGALSVSNKAIVTSGGYERYFIDDEGNLWWHIFDPATGRPAQNGLISATAVGDEGLYCDALSTSLFIMGRERATEFWREHRDFEMALVTDEGELLLTPGLYDAFTPAEGLAYSVNKIPE